MSYLRIVVFNTNCVIFIFFLRLCCQFLLIVHSWLPLRYSLTFIYQAFLNCISISDRSTGVVTTARLTHATPAAAYAHSPTRKWESDGQLIRDGVAENCTDIAYQLVYDHNYIQVCDNMYIGQHHPLYVITKYDPLRKKESIKYCNLQYIYNMHVSFFFSK